MVTIVKHEWHQVDRRFCFEIDTDILSEIYPDLSEDEITELLTDIETGDKDIDEVISDAYDNDVDIDWDHQYDDCWTDRKGGYDVTYELGDEDSYYTAPEDMPATHKCTKCKWEGHSYEAGTQYLREDGTVIEDYWTSDEDTDITKEVCPMCDSEIELTEEGIKNQREVEQRRAEYEAWEKENEEEVPCFSCGKLHKESELPAGDGQLFCPSCHEGWVMMDTREEDDESLESNNDREVSEEDLIELQNAIFELEQAFAEDEEKNKKSSKSKKTDKDVKWPFDE
jgi:uncharacterized Zn finger protein (UPF0148 family)